jgi:L-histidine N-alpha-methyltransferase
MRLCSSVISGSYQPSAVGTVVDLELVEGLTQRPLQIPSKYFYDDRGSALFEMICDLPEYYLTRTGDALLDHHSEEIARLTRARQLVELGAGSARTTRHLIGPLLARNGGLHYTPLDISRYALDQAEASLGEEFPELHITGIECDYTSGLEPLNPDPGCLTVFLGSTIGNFPHPSGVALLRRLRDRLAPGDWFLMGVDLVKPTPVLEAAYNDQAGVTAEFNKNILNAVNREAGGDFDPAGFEHLAFFNEPESQIEMYLVARASTRVRLADLDTELHLETGERIRTEISRKFTPGSTRRLLAEAGFDLRHWFESEDRYFALALARVPGD